MTKKHLPPPGTPSYVEYALSCSSYQELVDAMACGMGCDIAFRDAEGGISVCAQNPEFANWAGAYNIADLRRHCHVTHISHGLRLIGYLIMSGAGTHSAEAALAVRVYGAMRAMEQDRRDAEKSQILQSFLTRRRPIRKILDDMPDFPLEPCSMVAVLGYGPQAESWDDGVLAGLSGKFARFFRRHMCWSDQNRIAVAFSPQFPMDEQAATGFIISAVENAAKNSNTNSLFVGIGEMKQELHMLPDSYDEASRAYRVACMGRGQWWQTWRGLGAMRLLMLIADNGESGLFVESVLKKLAHPSDREAGVLLETLKSLESGGWNLKHTSRAMGYHYNTMKYRYQKLQDALAADLGDKDCRFNISLALKLQSLRGR